MASYDERKAEAERDKRYIDLLSGKAQIERLVNAWMAEATDLYNASPLPEEKSSLLAQRTDMVNKLKTALGV